MTEYERFDMIVGKLEVVKRNGYSVVACCPAHDDSKASLSVSLGRKAVVINCHAGCSGRDVMSSINMTLRDLYYDTAVVDRMAPGERTKVSDEEVKKSLMTEIFPSVKNYDGWVYNENRELSDRLVSYVENYGKMRDSVLGMRIRMEVTLVRLTTLLDAVFWYHDLQMKNHMKADMFLARCDKTVLRQFEQAGIVKSAIFPKVKHNIILDEYLKVCSRGIWAWERGLYKW